VKIVLNSERTKDYVKSVLLFATWSMEGDFGTCVSDICAMCEHTEHKHAVQSCISTVTEFM
jgi:hypothetical protein